MEELTARQKKFRAALKGKKQPTEKQRNLAKKMADTLDIPLPKDRTKYGYAAFIDEHMREMREYWDMAYGMDPDDEMSWFEY